MVAVNLSARQFREDNLVRMVRNTLAEAGLDPSLLELEITESAVMRDVQSAITRMHELKSLGVQISLDDFGTGYSSLAYLRRFPLDKLKIDQSFIRDVAHDREDAAIAESIIALGNTLRLRVIAEGVETQQQADWLLAHGCTEAQGYLFARPALPMSQQAMQNALHGLPPPVPQAGDRRLKAV